MNYISVFPSRVDASSAVYQLGKTSALNNLATALDTEWQASGVTVPTDVPISTIASPHIVAAVIPATALREGDDSGILADTAMAAARAS